MIMWNSKILLASILGLFLIPASSTGKQIVPTEIIEDKVFGMAANFLQHYHDLLSLPNSEEKEDRIRRVKEDGFTILKGNDHLIKILPENADFSIDFNKGIYSASWSMGGKTMVECSFPAKVGLMKIENKKSLELLMIEKFRTQSALENRVIPTIAKTDVSKLPLSDFYIKNGDIFISPELSNKVVFLPTEEDSNVFKMVYDIGKYPIETLSNIFMTGYSNENIDIELKITQYGYGYTNVFTDITKLYKIFSEEGCMPYWGVKEINGNMVQGLYLWKNDMGGYCHVVSMEVPLEALTSNKKVKATLNCYVRLDNLKNLFGEELDIE